MVQAQARHILLISFLLLWQGQDLFGQIGAVEHHAADQPVVQAAYDLRYAPLCIGETFYSLEGEADKKHPLKVRFVLNAFRRGVPNAVATRELQFQANDEKFAVREFFIATAHLQSFTACGTKRPGSYVCS